MKVARARGAHFARPDKKPASGTGGTAAAGVVGSSGRGRVKTNDGGRAGGVDDRRANGDATPELWPGPFAEARRVSKEFLRTFERRQQLTVCRRFVLVLP